MAVRLIRLRECPMVLVPQIIILAFESGPVLFFEIPHPFN